MEGRVDKRKDGRIDGRRTEGRMKMDGRKDMKGREEVKKEMERKGG